MSLAPYLDRIRAWSPALSLTDVRADPHGLNNMVIIGRAGADEWVFRFPRIDASRQNLRRESAVLSAVRPRLSVAVPDFQIDEAADFVAYPRLPGRPLFRHDLLRLSEAAQDGFAADVARFLHELHTVPADALAAENAHTAGAALLPPPPLAPSAVRDQWAGQLDAIRAELYPHLWADQHAYIEDLFAPVVDSRLDMSAYTATLCHNDLASYHLLIDGNGRLSGVLDFGEAGWFDPAADVGILLNTYGESFVRRMAAADAGIPSMLDRARFRAAFVELEWALKGVRTNNPEWFLVHLGRARDAGVFGG